MAWNSLTKQECRIRHILADGREVDSIEGHVVTINDKTIGIVNVIRRHLEQQAELAAQAERS